MARASAAEADAYLPAPARRPVAKRVAASRPRPIGFRAVVGVAVVVGLVYFGGSLAGSLVGEQARQDVVSMQAELQRQRIVHQGLRAQVDELGAPGRISAWALHNSMVRADALALQPTNQPTKTIVAKSPPKSDKYASAGGIVGL